MEYDTKAFFTEHEADDVTGFAIIDVNEESEQYRIAEKWERPASEGGPKWLTYWISADALAERTDTGAASYKQQLSSKQFAGIVKLAGVSHRYSKQAVPA